ncbi:unnamed protein product [Rotaria socialis]|uniref:Uncharacterized protein n=1 Tax=Rotaria socialis TaxID=392032 RepID=A0A818FJP5_9BILA|nr:unnamed protein product [Rotaria socialis]CAF4938816.1 unnamed protein product [Rotaria socialis]
MSTEQQQQQQQSNHESQSSKESSIKTTVPLPSLADFLHCYVPITRCQVNADILIPGRNDQENLGVQLHQK